MKFLFLTTIDLTEASGGTVYSCSILRALKMLPCAEIKVVVLEHALKRDLISVLLRACAVVFAFVVYRLPPSVAKYKHVTRSPPWLSSDCYDVVVFDHLETTAYLAFFECPKIYVSHNLEYTLSKTRLHGVLPFADLNPSLLVELISSVYRNYERKIWGLVDSVVSISHSDAKVISAVNSNTSIIPPNFEHDNAATSRYLGDSTLIRLGFIGPAKWPPNSLCVRVILDSILPKLSNRYEFVLAGRGWGDVIESYSFRQKEGRPSIRHLGYIADVLDFWGSIDIFLCPMPEGAGVNVKVCEALFNGKYVFGSDLAFRGINTARYSSLIISGSIPYLIDHLVHFVKHSQRGSNPRSEETDFSPVHGAKVFREILRNIV